MKDNGKKKRGGGMKRGWKVRGEEERGGGSGEKIRGEGNIITTHSRYLSRCRR